MGRPRTELIDALRETAARLRSGADYRWTHQGMCNCGHLAQTVTRRSRAEIHAMALEKQGDWAEHAREYCPGSGYPIDHVIESMLDLGLSTSDIVHLERVSDPRVLKRLGDDSRSLDKRARDDVVRYLEEWARLLEEETVPAR